MSKITALRPGKQNEKLIRLFLDGKYAFSLEKHDAIKNGLTVGVELSGNRLEELKASVQSDRVFNAACRYLAYRPRSEAELRDRLYKRGLDAKQIEAAIVRLKEKNLLNDADFAKFWIENRQTFSPRSRWMTGRELRQKGIAPEIANELVADIDENETAYQAVIGRARRLSGLELEGFQKKIGGYLQRRGFGYGVITRVVNRVWNELKENK